MKYKNNFMHNWFRDLFHLRNCYFRSAWYLRFSKKILKLSINASIFFYDYIGFFKIVRSLDSRTHVRFYSYRIYIYNKDNVNAIKIFDIRYFN